VIRKASKSDIPAILEIERSLFSDPWDERLFEEALASGNKAIIVSEESGIVNGYAVFEHILDEGHITDLAVAKDQQRQGIASALVDSVLEEADKLGSSKIFLEVRENNEAARKLYSKLGFREMGRRKAYYPKANEDAVTLVYICKDLPAGRQEGR